MSSHFNTLRDPSMFISNSHPIDMAHKFAHFMKSAPNLPIYNVMSIFMTSLSDDGL